MLVLSRDINEIVVIADLIKVEVVSVIGHSVRLGFSAPRCVPIFRKEIYERMKLENQIRRK